MRTLTYAQFKAKIRTKKGRESIERRLRISVIKGMIETFKLSVVGLKRLEDLNINTAYGVGAIAVNNAVYKLEQLLLKIR
jgi:hypothetical protein